MALAGAGDETRERSELPLMFFSSCFCCFGLQVNVLRNLSTNVAALSATSMVYERSSHEITSCSVLPCVSSPAPDAKAADDESTASTEAAAPADAAVSPILTRV